MTVQININGTELEIEESILEKSEYFSFILEFQDSQSKKITINNPKISLNGFRQVIEILKNKRTQYNEKYNFELDYFNISKKDLIEISEKVEVKFNYISFKVDKKIYNKLNFPTKSYNNIIINANLIEINNKNITINGFLHVLDIISNKEIELKKEFRNEYDFFGIEYEKALFENFDKIEEKSYKNIISQYNSKINSEGLLTLVAADVQDGGLRNITSNRLQLPAHVKNIEMYTNNTLSGSIRFERRVQFDISRSGDAFSEIYINVILPGLPEGIIWKNKVGLDLISRFEIIIGGQRIDSYTNDYINAEYELYTPEEYKFKDLIFDLPLEERIIRSKENIQLIIPINLIRKDYNTTENLLFKSIPLIAMQFHEIRFHFDFNKLTNLIETPTKEKLNEKKLKDINIIDAEVLTKYYYLYGPDRAFLAQNHHELVINQIQEWDETFQIASKKANMYLNLNHPIKDLIIIIRNNDTKELVDDIEKIKIRLNGIDCYSVSAHFLKYTYPNRYLNISKIPKGYYYYSFCKTPFNAFRGSTLNASRIDTFSIEFIFNKNTNHNIKIIATNLNLLRYAGGMAGQAYSS